ncbi:Catalase HPII [Hypsibius exemplaris]|uniref:catalase n=1 Tax=Hypsibius exemplaris TaxID=2072580 RepID=A0A1W0WCH3_HYPEX|nr:Catalase HPII [Hypsibius exemplaris]
MVAVRSLDGWMVAVRSLDGWMVAVLLNSAFEIKSQFDDPDFNRRQLCESIANGNFPEWELGLQIVEADDEMKFDFDNLDLTKLIPEEIVSVILVGCMVLNRNPDNLFAETKQVAFWAANIVPGVDFSHDPLMQDHIFPYLDTQIIRLGGPNFQEIAINRPICPFTKNNQRHDIHCETINVGKTDYDGNIFNDGLPKEAKPSQGFVSYYEGMEGYKVRKRSPSFSDQFSQAILFWKSLATWEQDHVVASFTFELSHCIEVIRERTPSPALSEQNQSIETRIVIILVADGFDGTAVANFKAAIIAPRLGEVIPDYGPSVTPDYGPSVTVNYGPSVTVNYRPSVTVNYGPSVTPDYGPSVTPDYGPSVTPDYEPSVTVNYGSSVTVNGTFTSTSSVLYDAAFVPGGEKSMKLLEKIGLAVHRVQKAFVNYKPIGAVGNGVNFLIHSGLAERDEQVLAGLVVRQGAAVSEDFAADFVEAWKQHRFYDREKTNKVPA